jgi:hypothetical protein
LLLGCCLLHAGFLLGFLLKMGAIYSSETSVDLKRTAWPYIPEDRTLHNHRRENLKSYIESETFVWRWNFERYATFISISFIKLCKQYGDSAK